MTLCELTNPVDVLPFPTPGIIGASEKNRVLFVNPPTIDVLVAIFLEVVERRHCLRNKVLRVERRISDAIVLVYFVVTRCLLLLASIGRCCVTLLC